jgi:hypothetical protein
VGLANGILSGPRRTFQVDLLNQVVPAVTTVVTMDAGGTLDYAQTVRNGANAARNIRVWGLAIPSTQAVSQTSHADWKATQENVENIDAGPSGASSAAPPGAYSMSPVARITWRDPKGSSVVAGGAAAGEFHIRSTYLPGFTTIYARTGDDFVLPADLPPAVRSQLAVFYRPDWMNSSTLAIGPRYPKGWSKMAISVDFRQGISRLVSEGRLSQSSPFVTGALSAIDVFLSTQGSASGPALDFLPRASGPLEAEIAHAMRLSLQQ